MMNHSAMLSRADHFTNFNEGYDDAAEVTMLRTGAWQSPTQLQRYDIIPSSDDHSCKTENLP